MSKRERERIPNIAPMELSSLNREGPKTIPRFTACIMFELECLRLFKKNTKQKHQMTKRVERKMEIGIGERGERGERREGYVITLFKKSNNSRITILFASGVSPKVSFSFCMVSSCVLGKQKQKNNRTIEQ